MLVVEKYEKDLPFKQEITKTKTVMFKVTLVFTLLALSIGAMVLYWIWRVNWMFYFTGFHIEPGVFLGIPLVLFSSFLIRTAKKLDAGVFLKSPWISRIGCSLLLISGIAISLTTILIAIVLLSFGPQVFIYGIAWLFHLFLSALVNVWNWGYVIIAGAVYGFLVSSLSKLFSYLLRLLVPFPRRYARFIGLIIFTPLFLFLFWHIVLNNIDRLNGLERPLLFWMGR